MSENKIKKSSHTWKNEESCIKTVKLCFQNSEISYHRYRNPRTVMIFKPSSTTSSFSYIGKPMPVYLDFRSSSWSWERSTIIHSMAWSSDMIFSFSSRLPSRYFWSKPSSNHGKKSGWSRYSTSWLWGWKYSRRIHLLAHGSIQEYFISESCMFLCFAGFMYSAVGSYIARVWRIFDFRYESYPEKVTTILIAIAIYINFFTHHFIWDFRYVIIFFILTTFGRTTIHFRPMKKYYSMNLVVGFLLVSIVIWIGENIATYARIWVYPTQVDAWHMVWSEKITAWFLLMIVSFVLVSCIHKPQNYQHE